VRLPGWYGCAPRDLHRRPSQQRMSAGAAGQRAPQSVIFPSGGDRAGAWREGAGGEQLDLGLHVVGIGGVVVGETTAAAKERKDILDDGGEQGTDVLVGGW